MIQLSNVCRRIFRSWNPKSDQNVLLSLYFDYMKNHLRIFLVFLPVALAWSMLGEAALVTGSNDVATIEATQTKSAASTSPFGKAKSFATHNNAEEELWTLNYLSCCNTILIPKKITTEIL